MSNSDAIAKKHSGPESDSQATNKDEHGLPAPDDLTRFKLDVLTVLAGGERYGLRIKRILEAHYDSEVLHGRLYPNLDDLVELGLVEKSELDKRTNNYALTQEGEQVLRARHEWQASHLSNEYHPGGGGE